MVYKLVLVRHGNVELTPTDDILLPLSRACKQLYNETKGIWFGCNTFKFVLHDFESTAFLRFTKLKNLNCPSTRLPSRGMFYVSQLSSSRDSAAIQRRRRNLLTFMEAIWTGIHVMEGAGDFWTEATTSPEATRGFRTIGILCTAQKCFEEGLQWSQAKHILELAIACAVVCGEKRILV